MSRKPSTEEQGPKVPAYIVTFSDMVTLLLTFFVMLLSLAEVQDDKMFFSGRNSFVEAIQKFGLGMFSSQIQRPDFGHAKPKYSVSEPDKFVKIRTIDAREEDVRRKFQKVRQTATAMPSQIVAKKTDFSLTDIRFSPGQSALNKLAKKSLTGFAVNLQQNSNTAIIGLYVLGLATEGVNSRERYLLSARRAQAAADFLGQLLPAESFGPTNWWGAGPGGDWVGQESSISKQSQILIAILRAED